MKLGIQNILGENSALEYGGSKVAQSKYLDVKTYKIYSSKTIKMQKLLNKYGLKRKSLYFSFPSINYLNNQPFYLDIL